jgi:hypothetical protein
MARNPNSLPESKDYYVRALCCTRKIFSQLWDQTGSLVLVMYHAEVPFSLARQYLLRLASQGYRAPCDPQILPDTQLRQLFTAVGAPLEAATRYVATLAPKRAHLMAA